MSGPGRGPGPVYREFGSAAAREGRKRKAAQTQRQTTTGDLDECNSSPFSLDNAARAAQIRIDRAMYLQPCNLSRMAQAPQVSPKALVNGHPHGRVPRAVREEQLLEVAEVVFAQQGYQGTSIEDIARMAGVTRPVVYDHFGSKEGIYLACVRHARSELERLINEAAGTTDDPAAQLWGGINAYFEFVERHGGAWDVLFGQGSAVAGPAAEEVCASGSRPWRVSPDCSTLRGPERRRRPGGRGPCPCPFGLRRAARQVVAPEPRAHEGAGRRLPHGLRVARAGAAGPTRAVGLTGSPYTHGLHDVGDGLYAYLQPDGGWGWSNAGPDRRRRGDAARRHAVRPALTERDAGRDAQRAVPQAGTIDTLVNTHANGDHCYGNQLVGDARIVASKQTAEEMRELLRPCSMASLGSAGASDGPSSASSCCAASARSTSTGSSSCRRTRRSTASSSCASATRTVQLIEVGPAHTRGDTLVLCRGERVLFSGDILFNGGHPIVWAGPSRTGSPRATASSRWTST